jgi:ATP:ADP antiporter, AAA family
VGREGGFRLVLSDKYLRVMALMIMLGSLVNTTGEYVISDIAADNATAYAAVEMAAFDQAHPAATPEPAHVKQRAAVGDKAKKKFLGDFFSDYYSLVNIVVFLLQALVVARLIHVLGIRKALFIMPVVVLAGWLGFLMFTTLSMIRVTKLAENSLDYSLHNTVRHALFLPTSRASKYKAKAAIDTFFVRTADAIPGLLLVPIVVSGLDLGVRAFAVINVVMLAAWVVLAARVGRLHDQRAKERSERAARGLRETAL